MIIALPFQISRNKYALLVCLIFSLCLTPVKSYSQKYDNTWIMGYYYSMFTNVAGLDFYFGNPISVGFATPFNYISSGGSCISDVNGDLLFYTNGCQIANFNNQILPNSGLFNYYDPQNSNIICDQWQYVISVPFPAHSNEFILLHHNFEYTPPYGTKSLNYSLVDMNANGGTGSMNSKNINIFSDTIIDGFMPVVKHANGRDWWVVTHRRNTNVFHSTLVTPTFPFQTTNYATGPIVPRFNIGEGQAEFSPDGSMLAFVHNAFNSFYLFDFDRCTGQISFRDSVNITPSGPSEWPLWGCAFSPNSQYLYVNTQERILQYDLLAPSLSASGKLIGVDDGSGYPLFRPKIGPDGRIYIISWGSETNLSVINYPDLPDTLCDFQQHSLPLTSYHGTSIPDFPNYRLGPLPGSSCDSLTSLGQLTGDFDKVFEVSPNPNNGTFVVSYELQTDEDGELSVFDINGRVVFQEKLPIYSIVQTIQLPQVGSGIYTIRIVSGKQSTSKRFVVAEH